jgi:hypothetical protein
MISFRYIILFILLTGCNTCLAQIKPELYLFFKEDTSNGMSKQQRKNDNQVVKNGKIISGKYDYDIYIFLDKAISFSLKLATIDKKNYCIKDSLFVKKYAKSYKQLKANKNIYYDTRDKKFPYKKVFIVEYINQNQYKIIQVDAYMGSDY